MDYHTALNIKPDGEQHTLRELSEQSKLLLVFLRHTGCTFCRETLDKLAANSDQIKGRGIRVVLIGMESSSGIRAFADSYGVTDAFIVSDKGKDLYNAFNIERGSLSQVLGWDSIKQGVVGGLLFKYGVGLPKGDVFQLPGAVLVEKGEILKRFAANKAGEKLPIENMCEIGN